jgi:type IX secretion system PorP/SprF family membrane protein
LCIFAVRCETTHAQQTNFRAMQKYTLLFGLLLSLLLSTVAHAQDPRFSQFYAAPYSLSPAMTGIFNGQWRTTVNYRDQWNSILSPVPFRTYAVSGEYRQAVGRYDYWSVGLGAMHDEAGTARFQQNKFHLSGAYLKQLAGGRNRADHYLSAGAQVGFGQNSVDYGRLWFSRQYDPTAEQPDFGAASGEPTNGGNTPMFLDFNAGLLWYMVLENGGFFYAGGAAHHLNRPDIALFDNGAERLYTRWSGHLGGMLPVNENFGILPGAQVMKQGPAFETDLGVNFRYSNNDLNELALRAGLWTRLGNRLDRGIQADALTLVTMLELNRWMLGLSYDFTVSSLRTANNSRGAFEVSLTYFHPENRRSRVVCPRF